MISQTEVEAVEAYRQGLKNLRRQVWRLFGELKELRLPCVHSRLTCNECPLHTSDFGMPCGEALKDHLNELAETVMEFTLLTDCWLLEHQEAPSASNGKEV